MLNAVIIYPMLSFCRQLPRCSYLIYLLRFLRTDITAKVAKGDAITLKKIIALIYY
ncbi:unknown [Bacteroides sp. CAG:709]|nr:unknown [Bacteroides sp. CAG:709]